MLPIIALLSPCDAAFRSRGLQAGPTGPSLRATRALQADTSCSAKKITNAIIKADRLYSFPSAKCEEGLESGGRCTVTCKGGLYATQSGRATCTEGTVTINKPTCSSTPAVAKKSFKTGVSCMGGNFPTCGGEYGCDLQWCAASDDDEPCEVGVDSNGKRVCVLKGTAPVNIVPKTKPTVVAEEELVDPVTKQPLFTVEDVDDDLLQTTLSVENGKLSVDSTPSVSGRGLQTTTPAPTITISGSVADVNKKLGSLKYYPNDGSQPSEDTLTMKSTDNTDRTTTTKVPITVQPKGACKAPDGVSIPGLGDTPPEEVYQPLTLLPCRQEGYIGGVKLRCTAPKVYKVDGECSELAGPKPRAQARGAPPLPSPAPLLDLPPPSPPVLPPSSLPRVSPLPPASSCSCPPVPAPECFCEQGPAATGPNCTKSGIKCAGCTTPGYTLNRTLGLCAKKVCTCDNGKPAEGDDCDGDGLEKCAGCTTPGYTLNLTLGLCAKKECTCDNGKPAEGDDCDEDGLELCMTCFPGFKLDWATSKCLDAPKRAQLADTSVVPTSKIASAVGQVTITFTPANAIPNNGVITVTFPTGFDLSAVVPTSVVSISGFDGTNAELQASSSTQDLILTRTAGSDSTIGPTKIVVDNIRNPPSSGPTDFFTIAVDTADTPDSQVAKVNIAPAPVATPAPAPVATPAPAPVATPAPAPITAYVNPATAHATCGLSSCKKCLPPNSSCTSNCDCQGKKCVKAWVFLCWIPINFGESGQCRDEVV